MAKKKKDPYFGKEQEQAVLDYINAETKEERDRIYLKYLKDPINKMIESIIRTYDYEKQFRERGRPIPFDDLHRYALSFLIYKADKFDPEKNKKAYSYYGTIIRNFLKNLLQEDWKIVERYVSYDDVHYAIENNEEYSYELEEDGYSLNDFIKKVTDEIKQEMEDAENGKTSKKLKENEKLVGNAVIDLLENWEEIFKDMDGPKKYNKMAVLETLREMTGLTTKDIRMALKRFKSIYYLLKKRSIDEGLL